MREKPTRIQKVLTIIEVKWNEKGSGKPYDEVAIEEHPLFEREAQSFLAFVGKSVNGEVPFFWRQFVEDIA